MNPALRCLMYALWLSLGPTALVGSPRCAFAVAKPLCRTKKLHLQVLLSLTGAGLQNFAEKAGCCSGSHSCKEAELLWVRGIPSPGSCWTLPLRITQGKPNSGPQLQMKLSSPAPHSPLHPFVCSAPLRSLPLLQAELGSMLLVHSIRRETNGFSYLLLKSLLSRAQGAHCPTVRYRIGSWRKPH